MQYNIFCIFKVEYFKGLKIKKHRKFHRKFLRGLAEISLCHYAIHCVRKIRKISVQHEKNM